MNREILFRGKRLEIGPFAAESVREWVYGGYVQDSSGTYIYDFMRPKRMVKVDSSTVGQYTGPTDKNGVKIFEGDIVRYGDTIHKVVFESRYGTAYFGLVYGPDETLPFGHYQDLRQIEVIGNVWDNPELLGGDGHEKQRL